MKNYFIGFLILLFVVLIGIGIAALNERLFLKGQAAGKCPVPIISENSCPMGRIASLVQNVDGCYTIQCN